MIEKDPNNKATDRENLKACIVSVCIDKEAKERFNNIPEEKKMIVTSEGLLNTSGYYCPSAHIWEINTEEEGLQTKLKARLKTA